MGNFDAWISRHRRRLSVGTYLTVLADALAVFLLAFGTAVLIAKLAHPGWWPNVLWLLIVAIPVAWWAWRISRRRQFSQNEAVAMLDGRVGAAGLLMTLNETFDDRWAKQLAAQEPDWQAGLPRVRPVRAARRLVLPVLFALGCCLVPPREARTETMRPNVVGGQVAQSLNETLELLKSNDVLDQKESKDLERAIEKLREDTKDAPLKHESWEVVDSLRETMRVRTEDSLMAASKAGNALGSLTADELHGDQTLSAERRDQIEQEAASALGKLTKSAGDGREASALQKRLQKMMKNGRLQLGKGADREKGLRDLKALLDKECEKLADCEGKCMGEGECNSRMYNTTDHSWHEGQPGRGGVTRGPGAAKLTWGDEAEANGAKFKEVVLPPGSPDQPNKEIISQSASAPDEKPDASAPRAAQRAAASETGRQTWNRTIQPRHRSAVKNYFESGGSNSEGTDSGG